jgi:hypothetical protein
MIILFETSYCGLSIPRIPLMHRCDKNGGKPPTGQVYLFRNRCKYNMYQCSSEKVTDACIDSIVILIDHCLCSEKLSEVVTPWSFNHTGAGSNPSSSILYFYFMGSSCLCHAYKLHIKLLIQDI